MIGGIKMGSCRFCSVCHQELMSIIKASEVGNRMLICKECEDEFKRLEPHMKDILDIIKSKKMEK